MTNLLSQLTKSGQARLLEELNYMNLEEIRGFCAKRGIPYRIVAEYPNGKAKLRRTSAGLASRRTHTPFQSQES